MRNRIDLGGNWTFCVPGGQPETRKVPGSYYMSGDSIYSRTFRIHPEENRRYLLVFDGILYGGHARMNGTVLDNMLPYSEYKFDITDLLRDGENELVVYLRDLGLDYGPTLGWRNYAGIVRDVYILSMEPVYVDDVFFRCKLSEDLSRGDCTVQAALANAPDGTGVTATISDGNTTVTAAGICKNSHVTLELSVAYPRLWSTEDPYLYQLTVTADSDIHTLHVGIRSFEIRGNRFFLNGKPCFLAGVCRHDMQTDACGFTQTDEQIQRDMRAAKVMGANYVRLVHYPHDKRVLDWADRLGLMVSEEPGLWGIKMWEWDAAPAALEVMERVIRRDRSHPSVIFWLTFNECFPTREYLADSVAVVRKFDPTRPVSAANFIRWDHAKELFDEAGMDFYTFHPYGRGYDLVTGGADKTGGWSHPWQSMEDLCKGFCGKPLVFTEWGGFYTNNNPGLFEEFVREMLRLGSNPDGAPRLAGMSYWSWSDIYEANRPAPACRNGILTEGLVTLDRQPKGNYRVFMDLLRNISPPYDPETRLTIAGAGVYGGNCTPLALPAQDSPSQEAAWKACREMSMDPSLYPYRLKRQIQKGPGLPYAVTRLGALTVDLREGRPLAVNQSGGEVSIPCNLSASALYFIGNVTMSKGYPTDGARGDVLAEYILCYTDGTEVTVPLRSGMELTTVWGLFASSPVDPRGSEVIRAFTVSHDLNWEVYHANTFRLPTDGTKTLCRIVCRALVPDTTLLLYGISAE